MSRRMWRCFFPVISAISKDDIPGKPFRVVGVIAPTLVIFSKVVASVQVMFIVFFRFGSAVQVAPTDGHPDPDKGNRRGMEGAIRKTGLVG